MTVAGKVSGDVTAEVHRADPGRLAEQAAALEDVLAAAGSVLVAFSGGADSALVLAAAVRVLGAADVAAATAVSAAVPSTEVRAAAAFAERLGVAWHQPGTDEMAREGYRANGGDRCFFCKTELMSVLVPLAAELGLAHVATGTNADDLRAGFRPGIRAGVQAGALTPLADAGLGKADVRALSQAWGLPTWDKPAAACLSSRIAFGLQITPTVLHRVERAEAAVRDLLPGGPGDLRVRDLGDDRARVELDAGRLRKLPVEVLARVDAAVRAAGFVAVEHRAFRSGSMNELLPDAERYR